ncbi:MAG: LON peptidase substrate-binding domain-containing protein [Candidatus Omnitrophica bacterium]|nr:LON peptidase substrate-binding domain-containing protein [Candidatus Omnitrophota bacterium]
MPRKKKPVPKKFRFPKRVAVFPLPNLTLFPEVEVPLYIFEPRYRQMLADSLAGNKFIAISLLRKGWEGEEEPYPSHEIVGVGYIKAARENSDGTSHIILKGVARARILRYTQMEPYRIAEIRRVPDRIKNSDELQNLNRVLQGLFIQKLRFVSEKPGENLSLPKELEDPVILSHFVSFIINAGPYLKQSILETTNVNCRVQHLISILKEEISPPGSQN